MSNYAVIYYCYKNASPLDLFHNPIPSICTLRKYSPQTPIVVLSCNDNEHMFKPYQLTLNFHFAKFTARSPNHQMAYKAIDTYEYLMQSQLDAVITCDTDIMWHSSIDDIYKEWESQPGKNIMLQNTLNNGLFGLRKGADEKYIKTWFGLCHIMAQVKQNDVTDYVLKATYKGADIHDESTRAVVEKLIGKPHKKVWYYPLEYCYLPCIRGKKRDIHFDFHKVKSWHYMMHWMKMYFKFKYGDEWLLSRIGRTGYFLSIGEYAQIMQDELGPNYDRFVNQFGVASKKETLWHVMTNMQYYYNNFLADKTEGSDAAVHVNP